MMPGDSKLIAYYSCFNLLAEPTSFDLRSLEPLRSALIAHLGPTYQKNLQAQMELLNIRPAQFCLELLIEVLIKVLQTDQPFCKELFRLELTSELDLALIWTNDNDHMLDFGALVEAFVEAVKLLWEHYPISAANYPFKLLKSVRTTFVQPMILAKEKEQSYSQSFYTVLERVSEPLENIVGHERSAAVLQYIKDASSKVANSYQVTRDFVTNIMEFKASPNLKVRVIQPAKEFYEHAIEAWLSLGEVQSLKFYISQFKARYGDTWSESLLRPAIQFFHVAEEEWSRSRGIAFVQSIKSRLFDIWTTSIVETSQSFEAHMMPKSAI